ncbi:MAG: ABC transporter ATP-binding protein [Parvibaculaceae bacterium]
MLLDVENLRIGYDTDAGIVWAVDGVSFGLAENGVLGIAGESGCGKSTLIRSLFRLLPPGTLIEADRLEFRGRDLLAMNDRQYRREILWREIALVPQSAMNALNPMYRLGSQLIEAVKVHRRTDRSTARDRAAAMFDVVGLQSKLLDAYPHELSGGMRQRALIAMALLLDPGLIVMDEPTTGLDVLVQERILSKLVELRREVKSSIILATHDIGVISQMSDQIAIMYAGRFAERAGTREVFDEPMHPYTLGLKNAFPDITKLDRPMISIPGTPPSMLGGVVGCAFAPRCPFTLEECRRGRPADRLVAPDHVVNCLRIEDIGMMRAAAGKKSTWHC